MLSQTLLEIRHTGAALAADGEIGTEPSHCHTDDCGAEGEKNYQLGKKQWWAVDCVKI